MDNYKKQVTENKINTKFEEGFCEGISTFINTIELPYSILISGSWGIGKTTLFEDIEKKLDKDTWKIIKINTWDLSQRENYREALLYQILYKLEFNNILTNIRTKLSKINKGNFEVNVGIFKVGFETEDSDLYEYTKTEIINKIKKANNRFLIFIDDLDRIKPHEAISTVDLIRTLFLDENNKYGKDKGVMCITACDQEIIKLGLEDKYKENADKYYDKYFKKLFQFTISPLPIEIDFLQDYIFTKSDLKDLYNLLFKNDKNKIFFTKILIYITEGNFRDIKRLMRKHNVLAIFNKVTNGNNNNLKNVILKTLLEDFNKKKKEKIILDKLKNNKDEVIEEEIIEEEIINAMQKSYVMLKTFGNDFIEMYKEITLIKLSDTEKLLIKYIDSISIESDTKKGKNNKDYTKYTITYGNEEIGKKLPKTQVPLYLVRDYINRKENNKIKKQIEELHNNCFNSNGLYSTINQISKEDTKRYHKEELVLGGEKIRISSQWSKDTIGVILDFFKKRGYDISENISD